MDFAEILISFVQVAVAMIAFTTITAVLVKVSQRTSASLLALRLKFMWPQLIYSGTFATLGLGTNVWIISYKEPSFWYMGTLALILAATLVIVVSVVLSSPIFDSHESKSKNNP